MFMKKNRSLNLKYAGSQIFYFAAFAAMMGYASVFLLDKGCSNSQIGIALALSSIIAVLLQPMLASFADNHKNIEMRNIITPIVLLVIALSAILYLIPGSALFVLFLVVTIFSIMSSIMPLMNSLAFAFEQHGIEINYGLARGLGSVAYAIASLALGHIVESFSPGILPLFYILFTVLLFIVVKMFVLPKEFKNDVEQVETPQEETEQLSFGKFCMKYKKFILFLVGFVLVYFAHTIINNFFIQIITNIGGTSADMGNAVFVAAMLELPTMAFFSKMSEKINCGTLIKFSILMFCVKHALTYFATNMIMIYLAQVCQMFAYALFIPASVYYVNEKIALADRVKGQSLVTTSMTLSGVFANFAGGIMLDALGVGHVLLAGVVLSIVGAVIVILMTEKV